MYFGTEEVAKIETLKEKVTRRNDQAKIIEQIFELAQKLHHCHYEVADALKHPEYINDRTREKVRKQLDYSFWYETFEQNQVDKLLTTVDKEKMLEKISENPPVFNYENAMDALSGFLNSKDAVATTMIKKIYKNITDSVFRIGGSYKHDDEKRIQKGIPKSFRLSIFYTYGKGLPSYISGYRDKFAVITDLERACFLVDNKSQPDRNVNIEARTGTALSKGEQFVSGEYFDLTLFKNGNVKVDFKDLAVLAVLNKWGREENRIE
jgi:hypothetical protein